MSVRFYRRVSLGKNAALNIGKTGVSLSLGVRGAHMTFGGAGGTRMTVGIPGTGLFYTHNLTAAAKRKARYEAKQQRDAAYAAERAARAYERERKRREREEAIARAVQEKKMQLAALKSEFEEFQTYLSTLTNFHRITMAHGEQAQSEFTRRCEARPYEKVRFPFKCDAKRMSIYRYQNDAKIDIESDSLEDILINNNLEFFNKTNNLTKLRYIKKLAEKTKENRNKLNIFEILFCISIIVMIFSVKIGITIALASVIIWKTLDVKYKISKTKKNIKLQMENLEVTPETLSSVIQSIEDSINKELNFYGDRKTYINAIRHLVSSFQKPYYEQKKSINKSLIHLGYNHNTCDFFEVFSELKNSFAIWMNPEQHKRDWLENEAKRVELLRKAAAQDKEAISGLCEALLPLSIEVTSPDWIDTLSLQEYDVAYHVENPEEAWLLIELPDIAIIPEYTAQLSPGGNSLTYPAMTERNRFALYDKCAASFALLHAQLLYLTFPFLKKIWLEAYTKKIDPATGMPRRKDIVEGYIDTDNFTRFNFINADPVEAIQALKLNFFPFSSKQFVEPSWVDSDERIIWASRDDDVPDGLLPF